MLEGFPLVLAARKHHIRAARVANTCSARGISAGTIDYLIAAMVIEERASLLTTDGDFALMAPHIGLALLQ